MSINQTRSQNNFLALVQALQGVKMELEDCGFDLLQDVVVTSDASIAFKGGRQQLQIQT